MRKSRKRKRIGSNKDTLDSVAMGAIIILAFEKNAAAISWL
jgi:hypothetical protein